MATEKLWCEAGGHQWERELKRGRKPTDCPDHSDAPAYAPVPQTRPVNNDMAEARKAKAQYAEKRKREALKAQRQELAQLKKALPKLNEDYAKWLDRASSATALNKITEAFDKADRLQNQIIATQRTIKRLEIKHG